MGKDIKQSMKQDLFIGNTSQLAHFWPKENTVFVPSRFIDVDWIRTQRWNKIYVAFADGRTWVKNWDEAHLFYDVNVDFTLSLIKQIKDCCETVVYFSTTELWNLCEGPITINTPFKHTWTPYNFSKRVITDIILNNKDFYNNVIVLFPFPFNSPVRKEKTYLFSKVFESILQERKIKIGDVSYYRDLLHPSFVVKQSLKADKHQIIGSGRVVFVRDFIESLYARFGLDYHDYIEEDINESYVLKKNIFYLNSKECLYSYDELIDTTVYEIGDILWNTTKT